MVPQQIKDALFGVNRVLVKPSEWLARLRFRDGASGEGLYVHLGCGTRYIEGMINCDANRLQRVDVWLDLRHRLPFPDDSVKVAYCSHTLEHLFPDEALRLLGEIRRVLRPDGVLRVVVPDMERALEIAANGGAANWPRRFADPVAQAINYIFCEGQHRYAYNHALLAEFAREAGFSGIVHVSKDHGVTPRQYGRVTLGGEELGSLVMDLSKGSTAES